MTRPRRLTKDDWFREGQHLLMQEGIAGMRLAKLVKRLRISTGSFYHHFADMEDYLGQLADHYSSDQVSRLAGQVAAEIDDPVAQIRTLAARSIASGLFDLDRAMRVWASSDPRAAKSLQDAERVVLDFVSAAFGRLGFAPADARLRAQILLSANLAQLATLAEGREIGFRSRVLDFLTQAPARDAAAPESAVPESAAPESAVPESGAPEAAIPETAIPVVAIPEPDASDAAEPEAEAPEAPAPAGATPDAPAKGASPADAPPEDAGEFEGLSRNEVINLRRDAALARIPPEELARLREEALARLRDLPNRWTGAPDALAGGARRRDEGDPED